jgi:hypothetical protein
VTVDERQTVPNVEEALILRDGRGAYYAIPRLLLDQLRVPDERRAELDALFSADTAGFSSEWIARSGLGLAITTVFRGSASTATIRLGEPGGVRPATDGAGGASP